MKFWSRFNHVIDFEDKLLLFNALSNTFVELPPEKIEFFRHLKTGEPVDLSGEVLLSFQLTMMKSLVDKTEDDQIANIIKMKRRFRQSAANTLSLTIAPTRECNFACIYCYEEDRAAVSMTPETETDLLEFISRFKNLDALNITWFGGEPLMRFDVIERLTKKFLELKIPKYYSEIISNGYLLTAEVAEKFESLQIKNLQVTIDGPERVHNRRRMLLGGSGTFAGILNNIDNLLASSYEGRVSFRINVDKKNEATYNETYRFLKEKFPQDSVFVHPGIVHDYDGENENGECFSSAEEVDFYFKQNRAYDLKTIDFFPKQRLFSCLADIRNGYVVGPEGELYKCWANLGQSTKIVGHLQASKPWNMPLLAAWLEGQNALNDSRCAKCSILPLCDGGCSYLRLKQYLANQNINCCGYLKSHLKELLKEYYALKEQSAP